MDSMLNIFLVCVVFAACLLTGFGLKRASRKDSLWVPSFAAMTTLKALTLSVVCINLALWMKASLDVTTVSRTAPPLEFMLLLLFAPEIALCLLLSGIVFLLTLLIVKVVPHTNKVPVAPQSRSTAAQIAGGAAIGFSLVVACVVYNIG